MQPLPSPPDLRAALAQFDNWGAVVKHHLLGAPPLVDVSVHQLAARSVLTAIQEIRRHTGWKSGKFDASRLVAENALRYTPQQFFGPCYEVDADIVLTRGQTPAFLNHYFREDQRESSATAISQLDLDTSFPPDAQCTTTGYAQALFNPPYDLHDGTRRPTNSEVVAAFRRLCAALFGDPTTLEIYGWPTDCSHYFDAGHEWWGSFFWTVYAPSKNWIVTILASTTD